MRSAARRGRRLALVAAVAALALVAGCSSGGNAASPASGSGSGTAKATTTKPDATSSDCTTTTKPVDADSRFTSDEDLPPAVGKEDDIASGNMTDNTSEWLQLDLDDSTVPNTVTGTNYADMPVDLALSAPEQENLRTEPAFPARIAVPAFAADPIAKLGPLDENTAWSFDYRYRYELGDPTAEPAAFTYASPFPDGISSKIGEQPGDRAKEAIPSSEYACDLQVPEGTPVLAIRPGVVATIDQGFTKSGTDLETFGARANSIRVLHDDGTWALYSGLSPKSARVKIGDEVEVGDLLALSGFTGLATEPHLHLAIMVNHDHVATSLPFALPS